MSNKLREALEAIIAGGDCACDHDDENCCERVEEYCPVCIAAVALPGVAGVGAGEAEIRLNEQKHHGGHMRDCSIFGDDGCDCGYKARIAELERALGATSKEARVVKDPVTGLSWTED